MSKLNSNYELVSDKSKNPVTTTPYIKHGEKWLDEMLNESDGRIDSVESGVAANTEAISQNTTNISTNTTNISGLDTRVTALEQGGGGGGGGDNVGRIDRTEGATEHGEIFNLYTGTQINQATGYMSHAEGNETKAEGSSSHSEGYKTTASGSQSHAEGAGSVASGDYSHAEGNYTTAYDYAHAEGESSTASGTASHAEGHYTHAEGKYSHAEGEDTYATKDGAHAEGLESNASGSQSHAEGNSTTASGSCSHAEGSGTTASGSCSHAEGGDTTASGTFAHAEGTSTTAFGYYSHAEGFNTQATASGSHAEGNGARAFKEAAHAEGVQTTADGLYAHAEGNYTTASAEAAHAEGKNSIASGLYSHAEGEYTYAEDWGAHSEGKNTTASGKYSHAENSYSEALGENSHAEGNYTISSGYRTHTEGFHTKASGDNAHAEGYYTKASSNNQHVSGTANIEDKANKYAVIVGNGLWEGNESNAYTLDWQGNAWYAGDVTGNKDGVEYKLSDMKDKYTLPEGGIPASDLAEGVLPTVTDEYNPEGTSAVSGKAVASAISAIPTPMQFKGTLGTGGTRTSLPTAEASNEGHTYRVITAGTYASQAAKVGDVFVSNGSAWIHIPAGDDAANSIVMTNYTSDKSSAGTSAIANTDTVTKAIGKVDNRLGNAETEIGKKVTKTSVSSGENSTTSVINVTESNAQMAMVAKISGKTYKKNLLPLKKFAASTEVNKVTLVPTYDGDKLLYITISGTATGGNADFDLTDGFTVQFVNGKGYILTGCPAGGSESKYRLLVQDSAYAVNSVDYGNGSTFTANANKFRATIRIIEGQTVNLKFYPMIRENTVTNGEYVPYGTLQNAPVESVVSRGKNLIPEPWVSGGINSNTGADFNSDPTYHRSEYFEVTGNTQFTFVNKNGKTASVYFYDGSKTYIPTRVPTNTTISVTSPANAKYARIEYTNAYGMEFKHDIALIKGTATDYSPYNKTTVLVPSAVKNLPDYGCSVGDIANEIDFENGVYYHNATKKKGSELTAKEAVAATGTYYVEISGVERIIASDYEFVNLSVTDNATASSLLGNKQCTYRHGTNDRIYFKNTSKTSLAAFKEDFANTEIVYNLSGTAKETKPISDYIRPLPVESGGTITLVNEHNLDMPSVIKYKKEV